MYELHVPQAVPLSSDGHCAVLGGERHVHLNVAYPLLAHEQSGLELGAQRCPLAQPLHCLHHTPVTFKYQGENVFTQGKMIIVRQDGIRWKIER